ncbi:MAG TPA: proton-conducting transporter membrane subunit [Streptosporangiaceae bacterium]|nr:proton-conducting transporter membrane subunit [Streptosporangiaceae bacterium]
MTGPPWLAWLLPAVPLAAGAVLAAAGRRVNAAAPWIGVAAAAVTLVLACAAAAARPAAAAPLFAGIPATAGVDGLSAVMVVTVAAVTLAVLVFAAGDLGPGENLGRFFGLMLVFAGAMLVTVTATTLALLLMGWEVMGATSYALIGYWWHQPRRVGAANVAFLTTRAADLGLYLAAGAALAGGVGGLALARLAGASPPWLDVITAGILAAALGKSAQLPFSFWLSRAMQGPSPVSALLHSATMVAAGGYLLLRVQPLLDASGWGRPAAAWAGAVTALALGLVAVAQDDLKQLLAASTCAQIGFVVLAAGAGGVAGGTMQLVAHAAVKSLLFLGAGAWLTALGTRKLAALRGAARRYPLVGTAFTVGAVALAGLPPASLWVTKDEVLAAALRHGPALYATGLAAAVVSAVYSVKALWYVWQPAPAGAAAGYDTEQPGTRRVTRVAAAPLLVLAVPAAALGVLALPVIADPLRDTLGAAAEPAAAWWQLTLSAVLAIAASVLAWRRAPAGVPVPAAVTGWLARWLDLERAADLLVTRPVLALARLLAAFDDRVLDRVPAAIARGTLALAGAAARADDADVDGLVRQVAAGARRLGQLARRPQTGQLHTYYIQAVVAFAALALVFIVVR